MVATPAAVPSPNSLTEGYAGWYTRRVTYLHPTTGVEEGQQTQVRVYNASGATVAGGVYRITEDGDEETNPKILDIDAQGMTLQHVGVSRKIEADATWIWVVVEGPCQALVDGDATDVAKDDYLKMVTATNADAFISDGTATKSAKSFAIATEAATATESLKKVLLLGTRGDID